MRDKFMTFDEFAPVQALEWNPVELMSGAWPTWMGRMSPDLVHKVVASGTLNTSSALSGVIGGIEVFRNSSDDPVPFNKDVYQVTPNPSGLTVQGPYKDEEHWPNEIPTRFSGIRSINNRG